MFQTYLTHVRPTRDSAAALRLTVDLAARTGAHLAAIVGDQMFIPTGEVVGEVVQMVVDQQEKDFKTAEELVTREAERLGRRSSCRLVRERPEKALAHAAAEADVVVAALDRHEPYGAVDVAALVLEAGAPVLALPPGLETVKSETVLIAWRNTPEARRAVSAALPLLKAATAVTLVQVVERGDQTQDAWEGLSLVCRRLSHHGIAAEAVVRTAKDAARALLEEAEARAVDLIVLGAYGHTRAREWVVGGVTKDLIERSGRPILLMH